MTVSRWSAFLLFVMFQTSTQAQQRSPDDPWWFEVEAIIFERSVDTNSLEESFPLEVTAIETANLPSFLTDSLYPDFTMLRSGASQCLDDSPQVVFPKQTAPALEFRAEPSGTLPATKSFWDNKEFRRQILDNYKFLNAEFVLENSPTQQWLQELENWYTEFSQNYGDWQEQGPFAIQLGLYPMLERDEFGFRPSIQLPDTLYCNWAEELDYIESDYARELKSHRFLASVPRIIDGIEYPYSESAYTLPSENLALRKLRRDIQRRRGLNVILHTAWRQNVVVGRDKAPWYRIYAGDNLSKQFDYRGLPVIDEEETSEEPARQTTDLFEQIQTILEQPDLLAAENDIEPPQIYTDIVNRQLDENFDEVWTLDGRLKVFIEYINGTPYLHIDSDLNYRKPVYIDWMALTSAPSSDFISESVETPQNPNTIAVVPPDNFLQAYHFDQIRRVISNEIHYFDHPLFGMVIQVRRHRRPDPELPADHPDNQ